MHNGPDHNILQRSGNRIQRTSGVLDNEYANPSHGVASAHFDRSDGPRLFRSDGTNRPEDQRGRSRKALDIRRSQGPAQALPDRCLSAIYRDEAGAAGRDRSGDRGDVRLAKAEATVAGAARRDRPVHHFFRIVGGAGKSATRRDAGSDRRQRGPRRRIGPDERTQRPDGQESSLGRDAGGPEAGDVAADELRSRRSIQHLVSVSRDHARLGRYGGLVRLASVESDGSTGLEAGYRAADQTTVGGGNEPIGPALL